MIEQLTNLKILVVDDTPSVREALLITLDSLGFKRLSSAENGEEALKLIALETQEPFELIFSDINMPKMGGIEFLKTFRKANTQTPVVMVSTENELKSIMDAINAGASNYVVKPFDQKIIQKKILEVFKKKLAAQK